jgi:hypothetical protein
VRLVLLARLLDPALELADRVVGRHSVENSWGKRQRAE